MIRFERFLQEKSKDMGSVETIGGFDLGDFHSLPKFAHVGDSAIHDEVWRALRKMAPSKATGPDGYPALFFQRTWGIIGPLLVQFVKQALEKRELLETINESLLVLIPKKRNLHRSRGSDRLVSVM